MSRHPSWPAATLRSYLWAVIALSCAPLVLLLAWQAVDDVHDQRRRLEAELQAGAGNLAAAVDAELQASGDALRILVAAGTVDALRSAATEVLDARALLRPSWDGVFLQNGDGALLYGDQGEPHAAQPAAVPLRVSGLVETPDGRRRIAVSVDAGGGMRLGTWIPALRWGTLLAATARPDGGSAALLDADRNVVATTAGDSPAARRPLASDAVAAGIRHAVRADGASSYVAWQLLPLAGWGVEVGVPAAPLELALLRAALPPLALAAACLLLGVLLASRVARAVVQPLADLAAGGNGAVDAAAAAPVREIAALGHALGAARERAAADALLLRRQAEEFEAIFEKTPVALAICRDTACADRLLNRAMQLLLGPGEPPQRFHDGEPIGADALPLEHAAREGAAVPSHEQEWRFAPPLPSKWVLVQSRPLRDELGKVRGAVEAAVNITLLKQTQARLAEARDALQRTQRMLDAAQLGAGVGFFRYEFATDTLVGTRGHAALFDGSVPEEPQPLSRWLERLPSAARDDIRYAIDAMVAERQATRDVGFVVDDGEPLRHLTLRMRLRTDAEGLPQELLAAVVDTSAQHAAAEERRHLVAREQAARREAEAANRAKDELLRMLGHELRNPLNAIGAAVEVLKLVGDDDALARDALGVVDRQSRHLTATTDELLDMARVTSGEARLTLRPLDLQPLAAAAVAVAHAAGAAVELDAEPAWISADRPRIEQVLRLLLKNAVDAGPAGSVVVRLHGDGDEVLLEIGRGGRGWSDDATLGLEWVRRLLELHGSTLERADADGSSAVRARFARASAIGPAPGPAPTPPHPRARTLLLVEDNDDAAKSIGTALALGGHRVRREADGNAGLAALLGERAEVAIVDIGLPGLNGFELGRRARGAGYAGRMIAVSGYGVDDSEARARKAGFDAYMLKPVDFARLRELIDSA